MKELRTTQLEEQGGEMPGRRSARTPVSTTGDGAWKGEIENQQPQRLRGGDNRGIRRKKKETLASCHTARRLPV